MVTGLSKLDSGETLNVPGPSLTGEQSGIGTITTFVKIQIIVLN